jgi:hypothetical protein
MIRSGGNIHQLFKQFEPENNTIRRMEAFVATGTPNGTRGLPWSPVLMSAFGGKADIRSTRRNVRYWPIPPVAALQALLTLDQVAFST